MKPKDLKIPFEWEACFPTIDDQIFYTYKSDKREFTFPGWKEVFGNDNPVKIEYCSGNGYWVTERAKAEADINWVALERKYTRIRKIWSKGKNFAIKNILAVNGEALDSTQDYFPEGEVSEVYVNFPDPWPKKRHAKHRLIKADFIAEVARILKCEGTLTLVTDDEMYSEQMIEVVLADPNFTSVIEAPYYSNEYTGYGNSYFEDLWREKGKDIRYHKFIRGVR